MIESNSIDDSYESGSGGDNNGGSIIFEFFFLFSFARMLSISLSFVPLNSYTIFNSKLVLKHRMNVWAHWVVLSLNEIDFIYEIFPKIEIWTKSMNSILFVFFFLCWNTSLWNGVITQCGQHRKHAMNWVSLLFFLTFIFFIVWST